MLTMKKMKKLIQIVSCLIFTIIWWSWIDNGWKVEKVKSWNLARLVNEIGTKKTFTFLLVQSCKSGWRPWKK